MGGYHSFFIRMFRRANDEFAPTADEQACLLRRLSGLCFGSCTCAVVGSAACTAIRCLHRHSGFGGRGCQGVRPPEGQARVHY
jgi:hypothetical protein